MVGSAAYIFVSPHIGAPAAAFARAIQIHHQAPMAPCNPHFAYTFRLCAGISPREFQKTVPEFGYFGSKIETFEKTVRLVFLEICLKIPYAQKSGR